MAKLKHMQLPVDKLFLREHIHMLFLEKSETELLKSFYFNITEDRIAFEIKKNSKNLVVQSLGGKFIDLERNYFVFRNKIFKITAIRNVPQQTADSFLSSLLGQPVTLSENHPADANSVVHKLHQDGKIQEVDCVPKPFLAFDDKNVTIDLSFFDQ